MPRRAHSAATASRAARMPDRRRIAVVAVAHRALDRLDHVGRRLESEDDRIADVQVPDLPAGGFDLPRLGDDVADGVDEAADAAGDGNADGRAPRSHVLADLISTGPYGPRLSG